MSSNLSSSAPEAETRSKALLYTTAVASVMLVLLFVVRFTVERPPAATPVIDTLELALAPLPVPPPPMQRVRVRVQESVPAPAAAAPVERFVPKPTPARPTVGPLPGNTKPVITSEVPSPVAEPKIDERGLYRKRPQPGNGSTPNARAEEGGSPSGQPGGSVAGPGGVGGIGLDVSGFRFGRLSVAQDPYDDNGRIVFAVKVDADGHILSLTVRETSVAPNVVAWYRQQLTRQTLVPTTGGTRPEVSSGTITLKITSK
jgi:periplasmic protein TonB